jgi:hypothetical protein
VRDDQAQRYARHLLLPDVGGLGQTALLVAAARIPLRDPEPTAERIAGEYLAAGGVGTLVVPDADPGLRASLAAHGPDTRIQTVGEGREVALAPRPAWWPGGADDAVALAFWRGALAAVRWMTETVTR